MSGTEKLINESRMRRIDLLTEIAGLSDRALSARFTVVNGAYLEVANDYTDYGEPAPREPEELQLLLNAMVARLAS